MRQNCNVLGFSLLVGTASWLRWGWRGPVNGRVEIACVHQSRPRWVLLISLFPLMPCKTCVWLRSLGLKSTGCYFRCLLSRYEDCQIIAILFIVARGAALPVAVEQVWFWTCGEGSLWPCTPPSEDSCFERRWNSRAGPYGWSKRSALFQTGHMV